MSRYIAFLRAINLGSSRAVKMETLRQVFESLGFSDVRTFLASGNVIFETAARNSHTLTQKIEKRLQEELGYEVPIFIRTENELSEIVSSKPFQQSEIDSAAEFNVIFLASALDEQRVRKIIAWTSDTENKFRVHGHEIYWLRQKMQNSLASSFQKTIGVPFTIRGFQTVKKIAEKYGSTRASENESL